MIDYSYLRSSHSGRPYPTLTDFHTFAFLFSLQIHLCLICAIIDRTLTIKVRQKFFGAPSIYLLHG